MSETPVILPKIRTSMQMSKASIDALKSEQMQKDTFQHLSEIASTSKEHKLLHKKILKIQHFRLIEEQEEKKTQGERMSGRKSVVFGQGGQSSQTRSQYQTPNSDSTHKKTTFSETVFQGFDVKRYNGRARRMSALVPELPQIFKEDQTTKAGQIPYMISHIELKTALQTVSSDELEESGESIVATQDLRRLECRRNSLMKFVSVSPSMIASPLPIRRALSPQIHDHFHYLLETAKILGRTHDVRKRHIMQRLPKRLFKDIV